MPEMKTIVVSAVNLRKGGTLTVLRECLAYLSGLTDKYRVVALVHDRGLCEYPGIEYYEMPWCTKSWAHRLWAEYVTMSGLSRRIAGGYAKVFLWLSLHDTTPRVKAEHRAVYCHTSFPFLKLRWRDLRMDAKIPLFSLLTRFAYRINVRRNDWLIVQQDWFRQELSKMIGFPSERMIVFPAAFSRDISVHSISTDLPVFLYPSTPDCHKNFELLCKAAEIAEQRVGKGRFRVLLTISGEENRYAGWLKKRWGSVDSIDFGGILLKPVLANRYAEASCLVFPSRVESWGLPISEFLPYSKPMMLADLQYAHETAAGAAAVAFIDVDDASALAELMIRYISGDRSAFHAVPECRHPDPCVGGWDGLFNILLNEKSTSDR